MGVLDVCLGDKFIPVIGVYMPHGAKTDEDVAVVYAQMECLIRQAQQKHFSIIVAGDVNAEIGLPHLGDADHFLASHLRGIWLRQWCALHKFHIANESSQLSLNERWTFRNGTS